MLWCPMRGAKVCPWPQYRPGRGLEVTVGIAALFQWNYAAVGQPPDWARAAVMISDRMITAGDIQYQPEQQKVARITDHTYLMVAGDYDLHSEAICNLQTEGQKNPALKPFNAAVMYGYQVQAIQRRHAESIYLAPLGLNTDSFLAQQNDMSERFVNAITAQLQNHNGSEVQAIIAGMDDGRAHIYSIDSKGQVRCFDDVGFVAIGSGAWHAQSSLMQNKYVNAMNFAQAFTAVFAAKKAAEVAPGVGSTTDVRLMLRNVCFTLKDSATPLWQRLADGLEEIHRAYTVGRDILHEDAIKHLQDMLNGPPPETKTQGNVTPITSPTGSGGGTS